MFEKGGRKGSMKKSKLSAGIMGGLLAVGALAACSNNGPTYNPAGVILTYEENGQKVEYTANDLFSEAIKNPENAEEMFNQVYKLVVRNYFTVSNPDGDNTNTGLNQMDAINKTAADKVKIDKDTAKKNAKTNNTSEKAEFESILQSHGCDDENELKDYYVFEEQQSKIKENFYKIYADENNDKWSGFNYLRDASSKDTDAEKKYSGYFESKAPYHVSHILVNVDDGASNNYWNGTISKENVEHLKRVVDGLTDTSKSFGSVAAAESDDGSKAQFGDLGIVDKDKATEESDKFVKEFILGLYSYDNLYNPKADVQTRVANSKIITPSDEIKAKLATAPDTIDVSEFEQLYNEREVEGSDIIGTSSTNFYPRNIRYNRVLNNHGVSVIIDSTVTDEAHVTGNYKWLDLGWGSYKAVLCARGTDTPIIVTRAGASYQGIHFILVNRSPFEGALDVGDTNLLRNYYTTYTEDLNGNSIIDEGETFKVKLSDYYTTKYPGQKGYPAQNNTPLRTYVNTIDTIASNYKERAEKVAEEVKSFDTNIERLIYQKYMSNDKTRLEFTTSGAAIETMINSWITRSRQQKANSTYESWEDYWGEYVDMLTIQHQEQEHKRINKGCSIAFSLASKAQKKSELSNIKFNYKNGVSGAENTDLTALGVTASTTFDELFNEIGGACNDGETHK